MATVSAAVDGVRRRAGAAVFRKVAGADGPAARERIHLTPGPRWFPADSPIQQVHGDASMFVGGLRALLLQSLHPEAMAAVAGHSGYKSDPWGRLARTSTFLAVTTFGTAQDAQEAVDRVRAIHERVRGTTPDGVRYRASDPRLLRWVHVAEVDSFLTAHRWYGVGPLDARDADTYVAQTAEVARALGAQEVPTTVVELRAAIQAFRPELAATPAALDTARFLLLRPPLPVPVRVPYLPLAAAAVALLPPWARRVLRLPHVPIGPARAGGRVVTRMIRWAMAGDRPPSPEGS
jgi:uncharacterized protein (DUF2236 family)